jgi:sulfoxide reductase heme-binding subunit YedZ
MTTLATTQVTAAIGGKAFWYLTRASGLVSLVLLSATILLGIVASVGWTSRRWPRFLSQDLHRNLSLLCITFVGVHVVTTVVDGYVPIGFVDVVLPFRSAYRPIYLGLGALCFDLLLAVLITSGLRHRIGYGSWRFVHWLAYLCWPIALVHGLGSGTDTPLPLVLGVEAACTAVVVAALTWREDPARRTTHRRRCRHRGDHAGHRRIRRRRPPPARMVAPGGHHLGPARPTRHQEREYVGGRAVHHPGRTSAPNRFARFRRGAGIDPGGSLHQQGHRVPGPDRT